MPASAIAAISVGILVPVLGLVFALMYVWLFPLMVLGLVFALMYVWLFPLMVLGLVFALMYVWLFPLMAGAWACVCADVRMAVPIDGHSAWVG
jgi:hypothetical protein